MTDISVIIVNYNVKHFLDQCIRSVLDATGELKVELIVVDNDSIDGSVEHIRTHFPTLKLIANDQNVGFAKANNQALDIANGKYNLLLNPDTLVENDTLRRCFDFMEKQLDCGVVGVRMIDGEGKFLPESKRGFPSPWASLMRLSGLSRLFPKSRFFNKYNLGYLSEHETNEVDVLCGAFMFIRREAIEKVGLLDEQFFMYGEDIDLSYRIQKGGFRVFYLPTTSIVHFKGESTKKSSLKYYSTFYNAMAIFARKHFGGKRINPFLWIINLAIFLVGFSSFLWRSISRLLLPILEFFVFLGTLHLVELLWARYYYHDIDYYAAFNSIPIYIIYSLLWILSLWLSGSYRSKTNIKRLIWGVIGGSFSILILFALMDNSLRHSRAIILLASAATLLVSAFIRFSYYWLFSVRLRKGGENRGRVIVVGNEQDIVRAKEILRSGSGKKKELVGALSPDQTIDTDGLYLQAVSRLEQVVEVYKIDEVLFSTDSLPMKEIMEWMTKLGSRIKIKLLSKDVQSIIGSHDRNSRGDLYTIELKYRISLPHNRLFKLLLDYLIAFVLLPLSPFIAIFSGSVHIFRSIFSVLIRRRTWVSYITEQSSTRTLPGLLPGIVFPVAHHTIDALSEEEKHSINFFYAKDYNLTSDLEIMLLNLKSLLTGK